MIYFLFTRAEIDHVRQGYHFHKGVGEMHSRGQIHNSIFLALAFLALSRLHRTRLGLILFSLSGMLGIIPNDIHNVKMIFGGMVWYAVALLTTLKYLKRNYIYKDGHYGSLCWAYLLIPLYPIRYPWRALVDGRIPWTKGREQMLDGPYGWDGPQNIHLA